MTPVRGLMFGALLLGALVLSSCAPLDGARGWLIGTWTTSPADVGPITFNADGSWTTPSAPAGDGIVSEGRGLTWKLMGHVLVMTENGTKYPDATLSEIEKDSFTGVRAGQTVKFTRDKDGHRGW